MPWGLSPTLVAAFFTSLVIIGSRLELGLNRPSRQLARKVFISKAFPRLSMK